LDVQTDKEYPKPDAPYQTTSEAMVSYADTLLHQRGFETIVSGHIPSPQREKIEEVLSGLEQNAADLLKSWSRNKESLAAQLQNLNATARIDAVLVQVGDFKLGDPSQWDFVFTGRMTAGTSSTDLKAGLVDTATGRIVWERGVFYREVLGPKQLDQLLRTLFGNFPSRVPSEN
jgi:hypothetical protein